MSSTRAKYLFYFSLLFFVAAASWQIVCFATTLYVRHQPSPLPSFVCENSSYDFGDISDGQDREYTFQFQVNGKRPVTIQSIAPGCGSCIEIVDFTKEPISAQKSGQATLKILVQNQRGNISKAAVLKSDDPANPYMVLTLKASVLPLDREVQENLQQEMPTLAPLVE